MLPDVVDLSGEGVPICVVGGYGNGREAYSLLVEALHKQGRRVIWIPSLRVGGGHSRDDHTPYAVLALQAEHVTAILEALGIIEVILLGHSMGGPVATIIADLRPAMVRRIIYLCSAGIHPDSPWRLTSRMLGKVHGDLKRAKSLTGPDRDRWNAVQAEAVQYVQSNWLRAIREGWTLGNFEVLSLLNRLQVESWFIAGKRDPLFAAERQRLALQHAFGDHFIVIDCCHDPQLWPQEQTLLVATLEHYDLLTLAPERNR